MKQDVKAKSPVILIVDDEPDLREVLKLQFEMVGFLTLDAESGNKALGLLKQDKVDVVLSDVRMPDGSGIDLLRNRPKECANIPFIFMTGFVDVTPEEMFQLGASARVSKPFEWDHLYNTICSLVACPNSDAM